jgi:hypothetical protein
MTPQNCHDLIVGSITLGMMAVYGYMFVVVIMACRGR